MFLKIYVSEKFSSVICSSQGEVVFNQKARKKHFNFHYFWSKFVVAELYLNRLISLFVAQHPHIPYALRCIY